MINKFKLMISLLFAFVTINLNLYAHDPSLYKKISYTVVGIFFIPICAMVVSLVMIKILNIIKTPGITKNFKYVFGFGLLLGLIGIPIGLQMGDMMDYDLRVKPFHVIIWIFLIFFGCSIGLAVSKILKK